MRDSLTILEPNDPVFIIQTSIRHTHPGMGKTYFVMSLKRRVVYQIADTNFGHQLHKLLIVTEPVVLTERQQKLTGQAKILLTNSVYVPSRRKTHTYFFGNRPPSSLRKFSTDSAL